MLQCVTVTSQTHTHTNAVLTSLSSTAVLIRPSYPDKPHHDNPDLPHCLYAMATGASIPQCTPAIPELSQQGSVGVGVCAHASALLPLSSDLAENQNLIHQ